MQATNLIGNYHIYNYFNQMLQHNKLNGAIIFHGIKGIGKFTWALYLTKILLSQPILQINNLIDIQLDPIKINLINKNSHPNYLLIQPEYDDKKKQYKETISVDVIRQINKFMQSEDEYYKVIIIDALDNLNLNASNAMLKNLEEPSKGVLFFLISHNYATLLDTITSRCIALALNPLTNDEILKLLKLNGVEFNSSKVETQDILQLASGSYSKMLWHLQAENLVFYYQFQELILSNNKSKIINFIKEFNLLISMELEIFFDMLKFLIIKNIKQYDVYQIYDFYQNLSQEYYNIKVFNLDKIAITTVILFKLFEMKI